MVINYLIPTETPCADEVGEKVLISARFYILLHVRESLGLILWAWFLFFFFFLQIIKFESNNSNKRSNTSQNIGQELEQWVEWKVAEESGIITPDQPGDSVATKSKAGGNWGLYKDNFPIYLPDSWVNSYSKTEAQRRRSWICFTWSLRVLFGHIQLLRSTKVGLTGTICMQHKGQGMAAEVISNLLKLES